MSCTQCGSSIPCSCSQQVQTAVGRTCVTGCGCGNPTCCGTCGCNTPLPASPLPFYACAPACPENHKQTVVVQNFYYDIAAQNTWNVPDCGETAVLYVPGIKSIAVGAFIWSSEFGYFEVTGFNASSNQVTVTNNCEDDNAPAGTNVPACAKFTVTDPPADTTPTGASCVAVDFTAPAVGVCIPITLTNLDSISVGDEIQIGAGRYTVQSIDSIEIITICNDGLGLVPGTAVIALDASGNYQYCITVISNCCSRIEEEFPDGLTPCSNFQNVGTADQENGTPLTTATLSDTDSAATNEITLTFENTSTCRTMQVFVTVTQYFNNNYVSSTGNTEVEYSTLVSVNGAPDTVLLQFTDVYSAGYGANVVTNPILQTARAMSHSSFYGVTPGATLTLAFHGFVSVGASGDGQAIVQDWYVAAAGIGIAV